MNIFFRIEENYLTKLKQYNQSHDQFLYSVYCNLFIYKLLKYDTNVKDVVNTVLTKENIFFILTTVFTKFQKMKSNNNEKIQFNFILQNIFTKLFHFLEYEEIEMEIKYLDKFIINCEYGCLFFTCMKNFILKNKNFPEKLFKNILQIIIEDKEKRYFKYVREYILLSFLEKYKEICKYSTTRINTLNHTDEEIQVSEKSDQLIKLYSTKIKKFIEIFKNEEKIYKSLLENFDDLKQFEGKNGKQLSKEPVKKEKKYLKSKRKRSNPKLKKINPNVEVSTESTCEKDLKEDIPITRWKKNSRLLKSIDAMEIPLKDLINISLKENLRSSSKKCCESRTIEREKTIDSI